VPETPEERRERVVRELTQLRDSLSAALAVLPGLVRTVEGLRALAAGEDGRTPENAPEEEADAEAPKSPTGP
jgi:hypothetical protein